MRPAEQPVVLLAERPAAPRPTVTWRPHLVVLPLVAWALAARLLAA
jgi:hypothetical protein